jgi:hypothetical protein
MQNKFLKLVESHIEAMSNGGLLVSDVVKFVPDYASRECFKELADDVKAFVKELIKLDRNLRVVNIKTYYPSGAPGNEDNRGSCFNVEIAPEMAPGLFDLKNKVTVPNYVLMKVDTYPNLPPIPSGIRKKERRNFKPVQIDNNKPGNTGKEEDEETPLNPYLQTLMTQDGDKLTRGDKALLNKNVKIPSVTAKGSPEVAGFGKVHKALPTEIKA